MKTLRSTFKTIILVASLVESILRFAILRAQTTILDRRLPTAAERATWLHGCCRRILGRLNLTLISSGQFPNRGLIVSNHLSHMDILLYGALAPVIFVAKEEVRNWPLLGKLAEYGGTVFVNRESPTQAAEAAAQIQDYLGGDIPVLLFPEGTSSDGTQVLPFRSPLFEPAIRANASITAGAIAYSARGVDESTLTYWGDKVFFPHLFATLGCWHLSGNIVFGAGEHYANRKDAARMTYASVCSLRKRWRVDRSRSACLACVTASQEYARQTVTGLK
jgi:1-acyl-sn-glycerol-3-phosphate acyltransferase